MSSENKHFGGILLGILIGATLIAITVALLWTMPKDEAATVTAGAVEETVAVAETTVDKAASETAAAAEEAAEKSEDAAGNAAEATTTAAEETLKAAESATEAAVGTVVAAAKETRDAAEAATQAAGETVSAAAEQAAGAVEAASEAAQEAVAMNDATDGTETGSAEAPAEAASTLGTMTPAENGLSTVTLPGGSAVAIAPKGVEAELIAFIEDESRPIDKKVWFEFDRLGFASSSAELTPESQAQVDAIVAILEAYPTVHVKIGGYTDNTGDPEFNLKLSDDRAKSVMQALIDKGIAADRLAAEGYGDQHPVASNDTAEGRALNRRTALSVRQR